MYIFRINFIFYLFVSTLLSQSAETFFDQGNQQLKSGKLDDAEESFNKAMQMDPSFAPAMQALSKLSLHRGDLKKANEFSIKAVQADEDFRDWSLQISKIS